MRHFTTENTEGHGGGQWSCIKISSPCSSVFPVVRFDGGAR